jgi:hypothetical protein
MIAYGRKKMQYATFKLLSTVNSISLAVQENGRKIAYGTPLQVMFQGGQRN